MTNEKLKQYISLKNTIDEEDYNNIDELQRICMEEDKVELKLELGYKLGMGKSGSPVSKINEFLYYADGKLIGYLGISSFNGSDAEINGMVHPNWRRKGVFSRLHGLAKDECIRREFERVLLLCDDKSQSAKSFIQAAGASYAFSEHKMKLQGGTPKVERNNLNLRKAKNYDGEEIARMDSIFFGSLDVQLTYPEDEEKQNRITYMIELNGENIGKIRIDTLEDLSYIYGFGILPEYRNKGYGREALIAALDMIKKSGMENVYLDVAADNSRALNIYISCGFAQETVMNYYKD